MNKPTRVQRKRTRGWRKPDDVISITRPGRWGNQYRIVEYLSPADGYYVRNEKDQAVSAVFTSRLAAIDYAIYLFERDLREKLAKWPEYLEPLRGKSLMCFCAVDAPCHGDVLIELANETSDEAWLKEEERVRQ